MEPLSLEDQLPSIAAPELSPARLQRRLFHAVPGEQGAVANASTLSFLGNISGQLKEDVLNSTLLAQLTASNKVDPTEAPMQWFSIYSMTLNKVGWDVPALKLTEVKDAETSGSVDKLVLQLAAQHFAGAELKAFGDLVSAMGFTQNEDAREFFNERTVSKSLATFQMGTVTVSQGKAQFGIFTYNYKASTTITDVLFFAFSSSTVTFQAGSITMTLDPAVYSQFREEVLNLLGDYAKGFILALDL